MLHRIVKKYFKFEERELFDYEIAEIASRVKNIVNYSTFLDNDFTCGICFDEKSNRVLSCGHSLCGGCVDEHKSSAKKSCFSACGGNSFEEKIYEVNPDFFCLDLEKEKEEFKEEGAQEPNVHNRFRQLISSGDGNILRILVDGCLTLAYFGIIDNRVLVDVEKVMTSHIAGSCYCSHKRLLDCPKIVIFSCSHAFSFDCFNQVCRAAALRCPWCSQSFFNNRFYILDVEKMKERLLADTYKKYD